MTPGGASAGDVARLGSMDTPGRGGQGSIFNRFAFRSTSQQVTPEASKQLSVDDFKRMCGSQPRRDSVVRLGSIKASPYDRTKGCLRPQLSTGSREDSPVVGVRRKRSEWSSDEEDGAAKLPPITKASATPGSKQHQRPVKAVQRDAGPPAKRARHSAERTASRSRETSVEIVSTEPAMRVRVDAAKDYGAQMVDLEQIGEVLEEDAADEVLRQCEDLSAKLKRALGTNQAGGHDALEKGSAGMATPELLAKACGSAARYIKSYQLIGINFLLLLAKEGVEGSILADEMGLGKTAQTICFLGCLKEMLRDPGPHLVICPASLLENWQRELKRWCPLLKVETYYGPKRAEQREYLQSLRSGGGVANEAAGDDKSDSDDVSSDEEKSDSDFEVGSPGGSAKKSRAPEAASRATPPGEELPFNVLLTCYTLFERDSSDQRLDRKFLRDWGWSHLILDEAHAVKNSSSMRTVRLNKVAEHCKRRVMLTGTPLQNDLAELQNLLRFLVPKLFTAEAAEQLQTVEDEEETARLALRMQGLLRPFVLRRLKTEVANQLMPKRQQLHNLAMAPEQARLYQAAVDELKKDMAMPGKTPGGEAAAAKEIEERRQAEAAKALKKMGQRKVGNAFVVLRKLALHPLLMRQLFTEAQVEELAKAADIRGLFGESATLKRIREELMGYSDFELHSFCLKNGSRFAKYTLKEEHLYNAAKCRYLAKLLPELKASGSRPLIFSQWVVVLDILEWLLQSLKLPYVRLDGSTAVEERLTTVDMFNNEENGVFAFLLSTRAGGQGLNLTGADTVILHDLDFNPQIDRQAEDRCHRLGQTRVVTIHRLVTGGTVDEGIHALAERKLRLDAQVLDGITASAPTKDGTKESKALEKAAMGELMQSLLAGDNVTAPVADTAAEILNDGSPPAAAGATPEPQAAAPLTAAEGESSGRPEGQEVVPETPEPGADGSSSWSGDEDPGHLVILETPSTSPVAVHEAVEGAPGSSAGSKRGGTGSAKQRRPPSTGKKPGSRRQGSPASAGKKSGPAKKREAPSTGKKGPGSAVIDLVSP